MLHFGLRKIRRLVVEKLIDGRIQHEPDRSGNIDEKNLLLVGKITVEEVIELIYATKGFQYELSKHHTLPVIDVHIFKPEKNRIKWYIKCYLVEPDLIFISVHH